MPKGPFLPAEFLPTKFSTATDKVEFGNRLLHFLDAGCARGLFTRKLSKRLLMTFGNIAHYVEGVIMRSVDVKIAWERPFDTKSLRIITSVSSWCRSRGGAA
jgi:hypothetical protein